MILEPFFYTIFIIWYFKNYIPEYLTSNLYRLNDNTIKIIEFYNSVMYGHLLFDENKIELSNVETKQKYEDKYLEDVRKMDKEYVFNEHETSEEEEQLAKILKMSYSERDDKISHITNSITHIQTLIKYQDIEGYCICDEEEEEEGTKEQQIETLKKKEFELEEEKKKLEQLYSCEIYNESELKKYKEEARQFIINKKLDNLKNNFVIEFTPVGNVLMKYDKDCETFKFYSDKIVPYTYLEVVGRKFVKLFNCRPIFVDMSEELKLAEEKWEKTKVEKEENDKRIKEESIKNKTNLQEKKKSVFAKFKSYNREAGTGHVTTAAPPKNSIPNKKNTGTQENAKIILKQNSNRYTHEGKFANFSFIQKIDKKVVDKKLGMSFSDYKKNICNKKIQ